MHIHISINVCLCYQQIGDIWALTQISTTNSSLTVVSVANLWLCEAEVGFPVVRRDTKDVLYFCDISLVHKEKMISYLLFACWYISAFVAFRIFSRVWFLQSCFPLGISARILQPSSFIFWGAKRCVAFSSSSCCTSLLLLVLLHLFLLLLQHFKFVFATNCANTNYLHVKRYTFKKVLSFYLNNAIET